MVLAAFTPEIGCSLEFQRGEIHYIYKKCGHLFQLVDSAISAKPVSDRCGKSST
jgi:hypothetical protein